MLTYKLPKFLVIRFAPGSAGNFLTTLLQCSKGVGHWVEQLEHCKPAVNWLAYFKQVYTPDLSQWLTNEPLSKQDLGTREIFSATYDRGNNYTVEQFAKLEKKHCSDFYFELKRKQHYIPIFWSKNYLPTYFHNSTFINIMLDQSSVYWFDRSFYKKHFTLDRYNPDGSMIMRYERHRNNVIPQTFKGQNQYKNYHPNFTNFARKEIFGNVWRKRYLSPEYLNNSTNGCPEYTISLADLLSIEKLTPQYYTLCNFLTIEPMPEQQLIELFSHWRQCHDY
jgi:hypothetical protein